MIKRIILLLLALAGATAINAQTKTTNDLHKRYDDAFVLFFYNSTLKMLNQTEDKEFDELIKDIEKMKFLMINKKVKNFTGEDYKKLTKGYLSEAYQNIMSARSEGKNFEVYLREVDNHVKGTIILVNDSTNFYVLDVLGRVDPTKATKFFSTLDESSDIAKRLKDFTSDDEENEIDRKKSEKEKNKN